MSELEEKEPGKLKNAWRRFRQFIRRGLPFASGVLVALLALLLYNTLFPGPRPLTQADVQQTVAQTMASATPPPAFSETVYQKLLPSLVLVESEHNGANNSVEGSLGSGVVFTNTGEILTALHVVSGADKIQVTFSDGSTSPARVTSSQPDNDIAVLTPSQPADLIVPAVLGDPNSMHIGDEAYAIGNPFGLYGSESAGIISGTNRTFETQNQDKQLKGLIQIDAAVNPGNSGGPLVNRDGQVVGIVVGILNPTSQDVFVGIGFAVPITTAVAAANGGSPPY